MVKPNFFIVGAPKCGTTAWAQYLGGHPDIFMPAENERSHFCTDLPGWFGTRDRAEYLKGFAKASGFKRVGEASPRYLFSKEAAANIREFDPAARIIILVRDHVDYLRSLHNQHINNGMENIVDFDAAWTLSGRRDASNTPPNFTEYQMLDYRRAGDFTSQIQRYLDQFGADQVRVLHFADWTRNPRHTYRGLLDFLGLEDDGRADFQPVNEARQARGNFVRNLLEHPPWIARTAIGALRRLTGREGLGIGRLLLRLNSRSGYAGHMSETVKGEIRDYYAADVQSLETLVWRTN